MSLHIEEKIELAPYTSYKIGGPARYFAEIRTKEDLVEALKFATENNLPYFILGGGTNLLVADRGYPGLIIKMANNQITRNNNDLDCQAGAALAKLTDMAAIEGLSGLEWAAGIPGTVGGAVRGNAGAFGGQMADNVSSVEYYDTKSESFKLISAKDCGFVYRGSLFKSDKSKIVWGAKLALKPGDMSEISGKMDDILNIRLTKHPKKPSAGSVFKNLIMADLTEVRCPIVEEAEGSGSVKGGKVGCGFLVERLGLKGKRVGGAIVSADHGNFILNQDNAKAEDVLKLIKEIKDKAKSRYGIEPQEEIELVGFEE